jgi:hypothetical protein
MGWLGEGGEDGDDEDVEEPGYDDVGIGIVEGTAG